MLLNVGAPALSHFRPERTSLGMEVNRADDAQLWSASLAGDGDAFGSLWDRHRDAVFRQARRRIPDQFDAEDAVAVTFLEAWRLRRRVRVVDGSVLPWLLATCENVARNQERSRRRYRRLLENFPAPVEKDLLDGIEYRDQAKQALAELSPVDRQLLTLTTLEGMNLKEAGAQLGLSHDAARARLSRARAKLRTGMASLEHGGAAS